MSFSERMENLVKEVDNRTAAVRAEAQARAQTHHRLPIRNRLGTVTMTGYGQLQAVDLDWETVPGIDEGALGEAIRDAIVQAQDQIYAHYDRGEELVEATTTPSLNSSRRARTYSREHDDGESWQDHDWLSGSP